MMASYPKWDIGREINPVSCKSLCEQTRAARMYPASREMIGCARPKREESSPAGYLE